MKKLSFNKIFLAFLIILVVLFWMMPNAKVDTIGNFFEKIITPLAYPLSVSIVFITSGKLFKKLKKIFGGKQKKK